MKKLFSLALLFVITQLSIFAQAPLGVTYQTVLRDTKGDIIANKSIALKFNIRSGFATGTIVYSEKHNVNTNSFGLTNLVIGQGEALIGSFDAVNWKNGVFFIETLLDQNGGTNYTSMGSQQLMSVPYALYAEKSGNTGGGSDTQKLSLNGSILSISNGNSIIIPDSSSINEIQSLSISGNNISLSNGGGSVTIPQQILKLSQSNYLSNNTNGSYGVISIEGNIVLTTNLNTFCGNNSVFGNGNTISGTGQLVCFNNNMTITGLNFTNVSLNSGIGVTFVGCTFNNISSTPFNARFISCQFINTVLSSGNTIGIIDGCEIGGGSNLGKVRKVINTNIYGGSSLGTMSNPIFQISNSNFTDSYLYLSGNCTGSYFDNSIVTIMPLNSTSLTGNTFEGNATSHFVEVDFTTSSPTSVTINGNNFRGSTSNPSTAHIKTTGNCSSTRFLCKISNNIFIGGNSKCVNNTVSGTGLPDITFNGNEYLYSTIGISQGGFIYVRDNVSH